MSCGLSLASGEEQSSSRQSNLKIAGRSRDVQPTSFPRYRELDGGSITRQNRGTAIQRSGNPPIYDPYPAIEFVGDGVFRVAGSQRPIYVSPLLNDCSLDGKKQRSKWCGHLISAGLRMTPPITPNVKRLTVATLTQLNNNQKFTRKKSG